MIPHPAVWLVLFLVSIPFWAIVGLLIYRFRRRT